MSDYFFNTALGRAFVSWDNPGTWLGNIVPNSPDAKVFISQMGTYYGGSTISIDSGTSILVKSIEINDGDIYEKGNISVIDTIHVLEGGSIMSFGALDAGSILIDESTGTGLDVRGTLTVGNLVNNGNIQGLGSEFRDYIGRVDVESITNN